MCVYIQGVPLCGTECALVGAFRCSAHRPVVTRQPPVEGGGGAHSALCRGAVMKEFRGTLEFPLTTPTSIARIVLIWKKFFIRSSFNLKLTWIKEFLAILSP